MKITVYPNGKLVVRFKRYSYPIKYLAIRDYARVDS